MSDEQVGKPKKGDPLHGITLEKILNTLVDNYGWEHLGKEIDINCFTKLKMFWGLRS